MLEKVYQCKNYPIQEQPGPFDGTLYTLCTEGTEGMGKFSHPQRYHITNHKVLSTYYFHGNHSCDGSSFSDARDILCQILLFHYLAVP